MGCDYYIIKLLHIYYNDNEYFTIELYRQRGDYIYDGDEDETEENYREGLRKYIEYCLTPQMKPITIYENKSFNKSFCETKYKTLIEDELNKNNKTWSEITKIIKVEERQER
jgi:hypothetical protein